MGFCFLGSLGGCLWCQRATKAPRLSRPCKLCPREMGERLERLILKPAVGPSSRGPVASVGSVRGLSRLDPGGLAGRLCSIGVANTRVCVCVCVCTLC